jgi:hypothetical protein
MPVALATRDGEIGLASRLPATLATSERFAMQPRHRL